MKLRVPQICVGMSLVVYVENGELQMELTDRPGNVGATADVLETPPNNMKCGKVFSIKEDGNADDARTIGHAPSVNGHGH